VIAVVVAVVVAVVSALVVGLAMVRMSSVGAGLRQTRARERELRRACEELLTAADVDTVTALVQGAVARLLPCGTTHGVTLVLGDGVLPASTVIMEETRNLPADIAARLPGHDLVLHCRLSVGERHVGRLYVAAGEKALVELQQAVPVLAGQAAGMIDHIGLNREIERRDGEAYFRTLVLNAADLILIVDDAGRVRYGNPPAIDRNSAPPCSARCGRARGWTPPTAGRCCGPPASASRPRCRSATCTTNRRSAGSC
jgi:PAS domain-containing protein